MYHHPQSYLPYGAIVMNGSFASPIHIDSEVGDELEAHSRGRCNTWPTQHSEPKVKIECPMSPIDSETDLTLSNSSLTAAQYEWRQNGSGMDHLPELPPGLATKKRTKNAWGNISYADLITQAILSSPEQRLTLSQIYDWIVQNVPFFKTRADTKSSAGWKNSIRHNLSLHDRFQRVPNEDHGKSSWWMLNPQAAQAANQHLHTLQRCRGDSLNSSGTLGQQLSPNQGNHCSSNSTSSLSPNGSTCAPQAMKNIYLNSPGSDSSPESLPFNTRPRSDSVDLQRSGISHRSVNNALQRKLHQRPPLGDLFAGGPKLEPSVSETSDYFSLAGDLTEFRSRTNSSQSWDHCSELNDTLVAVATTTSNCHTLSFNHQPIPAYNNLTLNDYDYLPTKSEIETIVEKPDMECNGEMTSPPPNVTITSDMGFTHPSKISPILAPHKTSSLSPQDPQGKHHSPTPSTASTVSPSNGTSSRMTFDLQHGSPMPSANFKNPALPTYNTSDDFSDINVGMECDDLNTASFPFPTMNYLSGSEFAMTNMTAACSTPPMFDHFSVGQSMMPPVVPLACHIRSSSGAASGSTFPHTNVINDGEFSSQSFAPV